MPLEDNFNGISFYARVLNFVSRVGGGMLGRECLLSLNGCLSVCVSPQLHITKCVTCVHVPDRIDFFAIVGLFYFDDMKLYDSLQYPVRWDICILCQVRWVHVSLMRYQYLCQYVEGRDGRTLCPCEHSPTESI